MVVAKSDDRLIDGRTFGCGELLTILTRLRIVLSSAVKERCLPRCLRAAGLLASLHRVNASPLATRHLENCIASTSINKQLQLSKKFQATKSQW